MVDGQLRHRALNDAIRIDMTARAIARAVNVETALLQRQVAHLRGRLTASRYGEGRLNPTLIRTAQDVLEQIDQALKDFDDRCSELDLDIRQSTRLVDSRQALMSAHRNLCAAMSGNDNQRPI